MPKQKSRVYQRYPGIVGEGGPGPGPGSEIKSLESFVRVIPQMDNIQMLPTSKPNYSRLFVCCMILLVFVSLASGVGLPILSILYTEIPYRFILWLPAQYMLVVWVAVIERYWPNFTWTFMGCYYLPLCLFYLSGNFQLVGMIDRPWYVVCVPLYPMIISAPASYFIMKHLKKLRRP
jgi:hypothetical protein